jgi:hypothetical protein
LANAAGGRREKTGKRERELKKERKRKRERGREREKEKAHICVRERVRRSVRA